MREIWASGIKGFATKGKPRIFYKGFDKWDFAAGPKHRPALCGLSDPLFIALTAPSVSARVMAEAPSIYIDSD